MKIKLDFNNENDTDKIRYLGYINQNSSVYWFSYGMFKKKSLINRVKHLLCETSLVTL